MLASHKYDRIQVLRFVAATAVVLFHAIGTAGRYFPKPSSFEFGKHGDYGVDLFFVISGFIMVLTVSTREPHWRLFLMRRLERIVPLYWLATAAMVVMLAVPGISSSPRPDLLYVVRSLMFLSWTGGTLPVVYPGWTIEFEMVFYLLIAGCMAVTGRPWTLALLALSACALAGAVARAHGVDIAATKILGSPMLLEFGMGVIVGHLVIGKGVQPLALAAIVVGLAGVAVGPWNEYVFRLFVAGVPSAVVVLVATMLDQRSPLRSRVSRAFVKLGDASYAIYLVQVFVISIGCKILHHVFPAASIDVAVIATTIATLIVAWLVHRYIERPVGRRLRRAEPALAR